MSFRNFISILLFPNSCRLTIHKLFPIAKTVDMKRALISAGAVAAAAFSLFTVGAAQIKANADEVGLETECKSAYLCDFESGTAVYSKEETKHLPIASMCKIMTLLLTFEAVDSGDLSYGEQITVSANAAGMGGSQVFLQENLSYPAERLIESVIVCSANDSCVALSERVAGSESAFVEKMNDRAKELGANDTLFSNCTGLPKDPQYSCAKDVSLMLRALLTHERYFEFSRTWLKDFEHPDGRTTSMTNTNKLIRFYDGCDGGKTGFTQDAGFCLAATAKRGNTRLVSVVIGADSSQARFESTKSMLTYAFNRYESTPILNAGEKLDGVIFPVKGGKVAVVTVCPEQSLTVFGEKGNKSNADIVYTVLTELRAPIKAGERIGEAIATKDGVEIGRTPLLAAEDVAEMNWWDAFQEGAKNWN